ncbi:unnamed protein product [Rotaria socialis]|uniref:CDT1 Geminin-binding domain-containing protein n=3 Tax=Rotaria socialis TaxID=392032 RepID=A0A820VZ10_9BILA|nr:unnamed protein product [Rotaria socialis]CAF3443049.1 unnamed protein product [Rotaria socialis]CAF3574157.1 unnamed protein product [Rotaria socialis]CAF4459650.1 unnamed protein product [Rotaria socialis]CAF4470904.1 unnamed protein product [Rotaria socialis]
MSQRTLLITDFFSKCRSTSVSNAALFDKPVKVIKIDEPSIIKNEFFDADLDQCTPNLPLETNTALSTCNLSLIPENLSFRYHLKSILAPTENRISIESNEIISANKDELPQTSAIKSSVASRIKFVRHHSAPLHHRSPIKMREGSIGQQELEEIRTRIRVFRNDLYKYKSTHSRSPIKRPNIIGDVLTSPFKHPTQLTPVKSYPSIPAYERFDSLTKTIELPLPQKYELLLEQYKHLDFLVCHTHNNGGISTFEKVQQVIQQKTKRNFTLETLGRIKTVYPTMYGFQQEKIQLPTLSPVKLNYELTITPTDFRIQSNIQITPSIIIERIDCFRRSLLNLVKKHHQTFLSNKLQLKLDELPNNDDLARWHPDFDFVNIPDIDISPLPESPDRNYKQLLASPIEIRHFAEKTQSQRVKRALFSTFSSDDVSSTIALSSPSKESYSIDGLSSSLIDKIRSKETNKLLSNKIDDQKEMLSRLEQAIAIVQQFFIAERATSLQLDLVAKQIRDCHSGPLSYNQSTETLHFLHTYPANNGWLSIITVRERHFIKVNRHKSINTIIETIQQELQK